MSVINNGLLLGAGADGYQISRSVRFRQSASAYFNRTLTTPTNNKIWTWSGWVKRGTLIDGSTQRLFTANGLDSIFFGSYDATEGYLAIYLNSASSGQLITTARYRDPSAWYHFVIAFDTTQATAANRVKIYVNGVQVTAFSTATYPSQNYNTAINSAVSHTIGNFVSANYFDGYMTEINFVDGQQLTPSSFGETDTTTGVWKPKKYTGTYGNNGYYLNFSDNSGATATTIGKDSSGNGNNWTPNNISVTAGVTYDSMIDVPTLYADGGNGRGNYAVMNPLNQSGTATPTNGNLTVSQANNQSQVASTIGMSSGKWYYEHTITAVGGEQSVGIGTAVTTGIVGGSAAQWGYYSNGNKYTNSAGTAYGASYTTGDVIGVAYDADAGSLTFYKNGTSQGVAFTGLSGTFFALAATRTTGGTNISNFNFGQRPFSYTPPTGFVALNTQNLPDATIKKGNQYFDVLTRSGTGSSIAISSYGFAPDFVWIKSRSNAYYHKLLDKVRGANKVLSSNATDAESTETQGLMSFDANGYTLGTSSDSTVNNAGSGQTYVDWAWKAGGTAVSNTAGTITSSVSANPTAGFSVVTYTGTGANATVGHGLGVAPAMMIMKPRNSADNWPVWCNSFAVNEYVYLNLTTAKTSLSTFMNSTLPTSTVFSVGTWANVNTSAQTMVAYCFAEVAGYSKFGSYTGNGSADGPFVYLGFRPRWLMIKRSSTASVTYGWQMYDTSRQPANTASSDPNLWADTSAAEGTGNYTFDLLSNGFKIRSSGVNENASGNTYIYMAFAENPFKLSLAR